MRLLSLFAMSLVAACTSAELPTPEPMEVAQTDPWSWTRHAQDLRDLSCPLGERVVRPHALSIRVIEAERGDVSARERHLTGVTLAGSWHLESDEPNFGGLSGLDILPSGALLAISDAGAFVWIGIDPETGAPNGLGSIAYMRDENGDLIEGKLAADAEGLSYREGIALVSFERDHRIEAFHLDGCEAAARAITVAQLDKVVDAGVLDDNRGAEALALDGDSLLAGFEMHRSGGSPIAVVQANGGLVLRAYTEQPSLYLMTGLDIDSDFTARLFRAYDPIQGPRAMLQVDGPGGRIADAHLKSPLPVDNFEGVAIGKNPDGKTRIWLIADDNFSRNQRTLLLALDLD